MVNEIEAAKMAGEIETGEMEAELETGMPEPQPQGWFARLMTRRSILAFGSVVLAGSVIAVATTRGPQPRMLEVTDTAVLKDICQGDFGMVSRLIKEGNYDGINFECMEGWKDESLQDENMQDENLLDRRLQDCSPLSPPAWSSVGTPNQCDVQVLGAGFELVPSGHLHCQNVRLNIAGANDNHSSKGGPGWQQLWKPLVRVKGQRVTVRARSVGVVQNDHCVKMITRIRQPGYGWHAPVEKWTCVHESFDEATIDHVHTACSK